MDRSGTKFKILEFAPDYRVGTDGSVWSKKSGAWRRLALSTEQFGGYQIVGLMLPGLKRARPFQVHRLILLAFVGPPPPGCVSRHLNGVPMDNRLDNLAWGTQRQNSADALAHGTRHRGGQVKRRRSQKLILAMRAAGLTSAALAERSGYHEVSIRRFRTGGRPICKHAWEKLNSALAGRYSDGLGTRQRSGGEL